MSEQTPQEKEATKLLDRVKFIVTFITSTVGIVKPLIALIFGAMWWATAFIYEVKETKAQVQELQHSQHALQQDLNKFKTSVAGDIGVIKGHTSAIVDFLRVPVKDIPKKNP